MSSSRFHLVETDRPAPFSLVDGVPQPPGARNMMVHAVVHSDRTTSKRIQAAFHETAEGDAVRWLVTVYKLEEGSEPFVGRTYALYFEDSPYGRELDPIIEIEINQAIRRLFPRLFT